MHQTFVKTIDGNNLEFNRLLYPVRYSVTSHDEKYQGSKVEISRDTEGNWYMSKEAEGQEWCSTLLDEICSAIKQNEIQTTSSNY